MFSLQTIFGKGDKFFSLLEQSAEAALQSTKALHVLVAAPAKSGSLDEFKLARQRERDISNAISKELVETFVTALDRDMLPDAEAALQLARDGFERARFSQLELLDAQRTLLELRRERIAAAVTYHQFVIEIEKLLGEPLSPVSVQSPKTTQP